MVTSSFAASAAPRSRACSSFTKILMWRRIASCSSIMRKADSREAMLQVGKQLRERRAARLDVRAPAGVVAKLRGDKDVHLRRARSSAAGRLDRIDFRQVARD